MLYLVILLLLLPLAQSISICLTVSLYDIWDDDGWYAGTLKIKSQTGEVVAEVAQGNNVQANVAEVLELCVECR